ncbi:unnamed protein product, partial [Mycena citricolor]
TDYIIHQSIFVSALLCTSPPMSTTGGPAHYTDQLKELARCLKSLPAKIPISTTHDFRDFQLDQEEVAEYGDNKCVVNHALEVSFGSRAQGTVEFKSRGPGLEAVIDVLREYITGSHGSNILLCKWVDDLIVGAKKAIMDTGGRVSYLTFMERQLSDTEQIPRPVTTTAGKRTLEEEQNREKAVKRARKDEFAAKEHGEAVLEQQRKKTEQGKLPWKFDDLEDIVISSNTIPSGKRSRGPPTNTLLDRLSIACRSISKPDKERFRCAAEGCQWSWASPRASGRVLSHATECNFLSENLREEALLASADDLLGARVEAADKASEPSTSKESSAFKGFVKAGKDERETKTNLLALELVCSASLPLHLLDSHHFRVFVNHLDPKNHIYASTTFSSDKIPKEASRITAAAYKMLKEEYNLTISYDGATIKRGQSIYTFHVTTARDRESYFVHGDVASGTSHTAEHIKKAALKVIDCIGLDNFSGVSSDSTGNTRLSRELLVKEIPTLLIVPDPCHHASNLIKNICALDYFVEPIFKIRDIVSHFSQSTMSSTHLDGMRVILDINHGLEKIGKTRFGTIYWAGSALMPVMPAISALANSGVVAVNKKNKSGRDLSWIRNLREYSDFEIKLRQLVAVLEPIARAIKCLEGSQVTVGDVWMFFVAITAVLDQLFAEDTLSIPEDTQEDVRGLVNKRFEEFFGAPGATLYLAGFFLDADRVTSPILCQRIVNQLDKDSGSSILTTATGSADATDKDLRDSMPSYTLVGQYLYSLVMADIKAKRNPPQYAVFETMSELLSALRSQVEAYTHQNPPFSARSSAWRCPYHYWIAMGDRADAALLAYLAIRILAILPNSMAEERTVSSFTRLNSNDRANQSAQTVIAMTKIQQHLRRQQRQNSNAPAKISPVLRWRAVKNLIPTQVKTPAVMTDVNRESKDEGDNGPLAVDCAAGLERLEETVQTAQADLGITPSAVFAAAQLGVNTQHAFFRDLLSDTAVPGAEEVQSLSDHVKGTGLSSKSIQKARNSLNLDESTLDTIF